MRPETKYARSGDVFVAYQVTGSESVDVIWAPGTVSHLDMDWEWPPRARFLEQFSSFCRLIRFDKRGTGLSDRPREVATLEQRTDDIRAVMDACDSRQAVIFGGSEGASMACLFAATYPERTRGLILWGAQARWVQADDYHWGLTLADQDRLVAMVREEWPSREYLLGPGAGLGKDVDRAFLDWMMRYAQAAASPSAVAALEEMNGQIDVRSILPAIRVPTLVLNRTGDPVAHIDAARDLAARIPSARFVEFPGNTHALTTIDPERVLATFREFITGVPGPIPSAGFLATVLFVDLVGSTQQAARVGDAGWRDFLAQYYDLIDREVRLFAGEEMDRVGDGVFARFDGPTRAIRCALALRNGVRRWEMELRSGVHTGEVEEIDGKIGGLTVHIGARVAAQAQPGEVLISRTVRDLVAGSGFTFSNRGNHALRGVDGEWQLFAVESP